MNWKVIDKVIGYSFIVSAIFSAIFSAIILAIGIFACPTTEILWAFRFFVIICASSLGLIILRITIYQDKK